MLNEVIYLIARKEPKYDEDGFLSEETELKSKVFAEVKTTTYKEYYEASRNGEKATDVFTVNECDYSNSIITDDGKKIRPSLVEYEGMMYRIIRRYKKGTVGNYIIELTCEEVE